MCGMAAAIEPEIRSWRRESVTQQYHFIAASAYNAFATAGNNALPATLVLFMPRHCCSIAHAIWHQRQTQGSAMTLCGICYYFSWLSIRDFISLE